MLDDKNNKAWTNKVQKRSGKGPGEPPTLIQEARAEFIADLGPDLSNDRFR